MPGGLVRYPGWLTWPLAAARAARRSVALGWLARRARPGQRPAGWPPASGWRWCRSWLAPVAAQLLWAAITAIRPGYAELLDPYRPVWYRLAVVALAAAVLFAWYALTRRRVGPAALAIGGLGWLAVLGVVLAVAGARRGVPGHAAGAGRRARPGWSRCAPGSTARGRWSR